MNPSGSFDNLIPKSQSNAYNQDSRDYTKTVGYYYHKHNGKAIVPNENSPTRSFANVTKNRFFDTLKADALTRMKSNQPLTAKANQTAVEPWKAQIRIARRKRQKRRLEKTVGFGP